MVLFIGSDNLITLGDQPADRLTDSATGALISGANVTATLLATDGTIITTFAMPATTVPGQYQGTLTADITAGLNEGTDYFVRVVATYSGLTLLDRQLSAVQFWEQ